MRTPKKAKLSPIEPPYAEAIGPDEQEALNELEALLLRFPDEEGGAQGN